MAQKEIINKVKLYLSKLAEAGIHIDKAYLYGSYANGGNISESSDIDVMIVSKKFDTDSDKFAGVIWKLTTKVDSRIEPYIVGLNRFNNDDVSPLLQIVKKEGVLIV